MNLREALANQGNSPSEVDEIISSMVYEINECDSDPEDLLSNEGLEPDYVLDLLNECR